MSQIEQVQSSERYSAQERILCLQPRSRFTLLCEPVLRLSELDNFGAWEPLLAFDSVVMYLNSI